MRIFLQKCEIAEKHVYERYQSRVSLYSRMTSIRLGQDDVLLHGTFFVVLFDSKGRRTENGQITLMPNHHSLLLRLTRLRSIQLQLHQCNCIPSIELIKSKKPRKRFKNITTNDDRNEKMNRMNLIVKRIPQQFQKSILNSQNTSRLLTTSTLNAVDKLKAAVNEYRIKK